MGSVSGNEGRAVYAAAAVERMIGESAEVIRRWQERYGVAPPTRSPGGQVLYSRDEVERLRWIAEELAAGREPNVEPVEGTGLVAAGDRGGGPQLLVLLAEHDPRAADLAEFFLRTEGYRVQVTFDADDAAARASTTPPDVALVELAVSGHAGFDLCRRLRETSSAPIVALSSLDRRDEALAAGAEAFLLKPIDPLLLVSTIKDLLGASAFLRSRSDG